MTTDVRYVAGDSFRSSNISQIPAYCKALADLLHSQPPVLDSWTPERRILLKDHLDIRIAGIFNLNARGINPKVCHINEFGSGGDLLYDSEGSSIGQGLRLFLCETPTSCQIDELMSTYNEVLHRLMAGWVRAEVEEHPDILSRKDPSSFAFFVKEEPIGDEPGLIQILAKKFLMQEAISCHDGWDRRLIQRSDPKIYLWIKKSELSAVLAKFCFTGLSAEVV